MITSTVEFYSKCREAKKEAVNFAGNDKKVLARIEAQELPIAQNFAIEGGYIYPPGFTAEVLFERAKSDVQHDRAMNRGQLEIDSKFDI